MKIEGSTYAVNTHVIQNMYKMKSLRLSISNQEVPYDSISIILDDRQALTIVEVIQLGVEALLNSMEEMALLDQMREIEKRQAQGE
jgi:hypothetical protein